MKICNALTIQLNEDAYEEAAKARTEQQYPTQIKARSLQPGHISRTIPI
jgi:hypothetical protein